MGTFKICPDEPIVKFIREHFKANPVRVPEERIKPLCLIGGGGSGATFLGDISAIATKPKDFASLLQTSRMADVSGKSSRKVSFSTGISILEGFLKGLGVNISGLGEIEAAFTGADEISFSFGNVERQYVEPFEIGGFLAGMRLNVNNPAMAPYIGEYARQLLILDSVITSKDFTIKAEKKGSQEFKIDVKAIEETLGKLKLNVKAESLNKADVTFKGPKELGFAFSCLQIAVTAEGKVVSLDQDPMTRRFGSEEHAIPVWLPEEKTLLTEPDELLEWE